MPTMTWLSNATGNKAGHSTRKLFCHGNKSPNSLPLGILSFETAKTMSHLIGLYRSLSDDEFFNLRKGAMKSKGVVFLNSKDENFLLGLACAEKLEDLDRAAATVSRLVNKCTDSAPKRFDQIFSEMTLGIMDLGKLEYASKNYEKLVEKMDKYVKATSNLHAAMASLAEMEISERKLKKWKQNLGPKQPNTDYFNEKITYQRKQVKHYKDTSLWNQTFDRSVTLMSRIVSVIYARICVLFGPFVSDLPRPTKNVKPFLHQKITRMRVHPESNFSLLPDKNKKRTISDPILKTRRKISAIRIVKSGPLPKFEEKIDIDIDNNNSPPFKIGKNKKVTHLASESTVGGAGLALRYANIIIVAESYLYSPTNVSDEARGYFYELLPENLKTAVRAKLWGGWCTRTEETNECQQVVAEPWREALEELMAWMGPVAHDTLKWQQERYLEKQRFDAKPTVMLLQTLYFSDLEKTEAAIVELLVGLSYVYRYENRRLGGRPGRGGCR
ncbi:hypothetical protein Pint_35369 [Pistacia integerrima]|uniref:Uncharacterized protein n=1 Tax=Pistacia integerrima TaxID=434235 RepID=A0ACC0Y1G3_9ROSI|nr:hypothetical protein Pint_35369 [Pistacia integerrima]